LREKNVLEFKRLFLGADDWGEKAIIENDSILIFERNYVQKKISISDSIKIEIKYGGIKKKDILSWDADSSSITIRELLNFKVSASAPLIIDMPLLGYKLQVDLVEFNAQNIKGNLQYGSLGYYYFQPYKTDSKSKNKKFKKNRQAVYFNSRQHFYRSLYANKLAQNGYRIIEKTDNNSTNIKYEPIKIDTYLKPTKDGSKQIIGLKNKDLRVLYFRKTNGTPIDLSRKKGSVYSPSSIYFLSDTCTIRSDGTIQDSNILFSGTIGNKRVGSLLPNDYTNE